ncbi:MAG: hypothetical protein RLZZ244_1407 [Verrucomicrobiota bacterium]
MRARTPGAARHALRGMTLLELLFTVAMLSVATVATIDLFLAISSRINVHLRRERVLLGSERFVSDFQTALRRASRITVYASRSAPKIPCQSGNFCVFSLPNGKDLELEWTPNPAPSHEQGTLKICERFPSDPVNSLPCARAVAPLNGTPTPTLFTHQDGVLKLEFLASIGNETFSTAAVKQGDHRETVRFVASGRTLKLP